MTRSFDRFSRQESVTMSDMCQCDLMCDAPVYCFGHVRCNGIAMTTTSSQPMQIQITIFLRQPQLLSALSFPGPFECGERGISRSVTPTGLFATTVTESTSLSFLVSRRDLSPACVAGCRLDLLLFPFLQVRQPGLFAFISFPVFTWQQNQLICSRVM